MDVENSFVDDAVSLYPPRPLPFIRSFSSEEEQVKFLDEFPDLNGFIVNLNSDMLSDSMLSLATNEPTGSLLSPSISPALSMDTNESNINSAGCQNFESFNEVNDQVVEPSPTFFSSSTSLTGSSTSISSQSDHTENNPAYVNNNAEMELSILPDGSMMMKDLVMIVNQPNQFGRFRYRSEQRERYLEGEVSAPEVAISPAVAHLVPVGTMITVTAGTRTLDENQVPYEHWHELGGTTSVPLVLHSDGSLRAVFDRLSVLMEKAAPVSKSKKTGTEKLTKQSHKLSRNKDDQRAVRLIFRVSFNPKVTNDAFDIEQSLIRGEVFSHPVYNAHLSISRISHPSGSVEGGLSIIVLSSKVRQLKTTIRISDVGYPKNLGVGGDCNRTYGIWRTHDSNECSSLLIDPLRVTVHHQYAMVFDLPPYHDLCIQESRKVQIQIIDLDDDTQSEPVDFFYTPSENVRREKANMKKKRKFDNDINKFYQQFRFDRTYGEGDGNGDGDGGGNSNFFNEFVNFHGNNATICSGLSTDIKEEHLCIRHRTTHMYMEAIRMFAISGDPTFLLASQQKLASIQDEYGDTPLHHAVSGGNHDVVKSLVSVLKKHDLNTLNDDGDSAIHIAVRSGFSNCVRTLLSAGINMQLFDRVGNSVLHLACAEGTADILCMIIDHLGYETRAMLASVNHRGMQPLSVATVSGNVGSVSALLSHHIVAKIDGFIEFSEITHGSTALHFAVAANDFEIASLLLEHHADADSRNYDMETPLHIAASCYFHDITMLLIDAGATVTAANMNCETPLSISRDCDKTTEILRSHKLPKAYSTFSTFSTSERPLQQDNDKKVYNQLSSSKDVEWTSFDDHLSDDSCEVVREKPDSIHPQSSTDEIEWEVLDSKMVALDVSEHDLNVHFLHKMNLPNMSKMLSVNSMRPPSRYKPKSLKRQSSRNEFSFSYPLPDASIKLKRESNINHAVTTSIENYKDSLGKADMIQDLTGSILHIPE